MQLKCINSILNVCHDDINETSINAVSVIYCNRTIDSSNEKLMPETEKLLF